MGSGEYLSDFSWLPVASREAPASEAAREALAWGLQAQIEAAPAPLLVGVQQGVGKLALLRTPALDDFGEHRLDQMRPFQIAGIGVARAFQNIALWTDYEGADPEVVTDPNAAFGVGRTDFLTLPNPKRALLRVNLSF